MSASGWTMLLAVTAAALLLAPLLPAWREWRRPTDHGALRVAADQTNRADFFAMLFRAEVAQRRAEALPVLPPPSEWHRASGPIVVERSLQLHAPARTGAAVYVEGDFEAPDASVFGAVLATGDLRLGARCQVQQWLHADGAIVLGRGCAALRRISAGHAIELAAECCFERMHAPIVRFGSAAQIRVDDETLAAAASGSFADLPGCRAMAPGFYRVEGNVVLASGASYEGSLVVTGSLVIGDGTVIRGSVKARRGVAVGVDAQVFGSVCCESSIHIGRAAYVDGPVISEADVIIAADAVIGRPSLPSTVTAENIMVESGVVAHGSIWAREVGVVWSAA